MTAQQHLLANNYFAIRSFTYDVLRRFFLEEPKKELIRTLQDMNLDDFPFIRESTSIKEGVDLVSTFFNQNDIEDIFDQLHWDYTRMFIGPYEIPAPLWESAYVNEERLLFQKETLQVRLAYLKYHLLPEQFGREADDHLGLELDFLYQLNVLTMETEDNHRRKEVIIDQIDFLEKHLLKWVPLLQENIITHARFDFYKGMIQILRGFLEVDKECLEELVTTKLYTDEK